MPKQPNQNQMNAANRQQKQRQGQNQEAPAMSATQNTGAPEERGPNRKP